MIVFCKNKCGTVEQSKASPAKSLTSHQKKSSHSVAESFLGLVGGYFFGTNMDQPKWKISTKHWAPPATARGARGPLSRRRGSTQNDSTPSQQTIPGDASVDFEDQDQQLQGAAFSAPTSGHPLQSRQIFPPRADRDRFAVHST